MSKPVLIVTTRHVKGVEERIDRNYDARRNPNEAPFSRQALLSAADGADALFITPVDRLDSEFFKTHLTIGKSDCDFLRGIRAH